MGPFGGVLWARLVSCDWLVGLVRKFGPGAPGMMNVVSGSKRLQRSDVRLTSAGMTNKKGTSFALTSPAYQDRVFREDNRNYLEGKIVWAEVEISASGAQTIFLDRPKLPQISFHFPGTGTGNRPFSSALTGAGLS